MVKFPSCLQPLFSFKKRSLTSLADRGDLRVDRPYAINTFPGDELGGLSVEELLAEIDYALQPPEPCGCDRYHHAIWAAGLIGDQQKTTHAPPCKWHIPYRLRWWKEEP